VKRITASRTRRRCSCPRPSRSCACSVAEARERKLYGTTDPVEIERVLKSYRDFVALCARKEAETGEPCLIIANY